MDEQLNWQIIWCFYFRLWVKIVSYCFIWCVLFWALCMSLVHFIYFVRFFCRRVRAWLMASILSVGASIWPANISSLPSGMGPTLSLTCSSKISIRGCSTVCHPLSEVRFALGPLARSLFFRGRSCRDFFMLPLVWVLSWQVFDPALFSGIDLNWFLEPRMLTGPGSFFWTFSWL